MGIVMGTVMKSTLVIVCLLVAFSGAAFGQAQTPESSGSAAASMPTTSLDDLLERVGRRSGKTFLADARVPPTVVVGQLQARDVTYDNLLTILGNNGLAAVGIDDVVNIVPVSVVRQHALPVLGDDDTAVNQEWVTRIVELENVLARDVVPILRPLLPQAGHLAANNAANSILIVDRYSNVRRVTEIARRIDATAGRRTD